ncbi:MAG: metalloregulator ArsR/SmtB family transcription factor [Candidatus Izimaplasma sp.]|nr:metalloregulator ArsR/SmtB family transcription factor [Candidatus Izimaplasma bacterium]
MKTNLANIFKALGDENRLTLLDLITKGETCGCTLIDKLNVSQPTMTYHINILENAGLITSRKEGTWRKLFINKEALITISNFIADLESSEETVNG